MLHEAPAAGPGAPFLAGCTVAANRPGRTFRKVCSLHTTAATLLESNWATKRNGDTSETWQTDSMPQQGAIMVAQGRTLASKGKDGNTMEPQLGIKDRLPQSGKEREHPHRV